MLFMDLGPPRLFALGTQTQTTDLVQGIASRTHHKIMLQFIVSSGAWSRLPGQIDRALYVGAHQRAFLL